MMLTHTTKSYGNTGSDSGRGMLAYVYLSFLAFGFLVRESYPDLGLSSFLTLSVAVQLFALICLRCRVAHSEGVKGLSQKSLLMQGFSFFLRLCSTTWLRGYVPVDHTGDGLYQLLDFGALLMALHLVYCFHSSKYSHTYQAEEDTADAKLLLVACITLAVLVHPDLNDRPLFDTTWTASLYVDSVALFPQLWMMSRLGGVESSEVIAHLGISSHYLFGVAMSRAANFVFWYHGYPELAPQDASKFNWPGYSVIAAHLIQLLLLTDFLFYYMKGMWAELQARGVIGGMCLPVSGCRNGSGGLLHTTIPLSIARMLKPTSLSETHEVQVHSI